MKSSKFMFVIILVVTGLTNSAITNPGTAQTYEPRYAMEVARKNRINHISLTSLHFCPRWSELLIDRSQRGQRLVLKKTSDDQAILNPANEPLGGSLNTIDLKEVNETTAKTLWGGRSNTEGGITCDLLTEVGTPEMDIFHLDMKFANDKLSSYRLRGSGIIKPTWISLDTKNSGEKK